MQRPEFDIIKDYAEFSKYYWYKDELMWKPVKIKR